MSLSSALVNAAALQDHLARALKLPAMRLAAPALPAGVPPVATGHASTGGPPSASSAAAASAEWEALNPGHARALSLAQRRGLVDRPSSPLRPEAWAAAHAAARARGATTSECPICRDGFRSEAQSLTSCGHVYHATCLSSFEAFAAAAGGPGRCCPVCRCRHYQVVHINDGRDEYKHACATRVQAAIRGHLGRRRAAALRRTVPPRDPARRRQWAGDRLGEASDALLGRMAAAVPADLDRFLAEIDASVAGAKRTMRAATGEGAAVAAEGVAWASHQVAAAAADAARAARALAVVRDGGVDWDDVMTRALERGETDCPICLGPLDPPAPKRAAKRAAVTGPHKGGVAWCSCTHAFHANCLGSYEAFAVAAATDGAKPAPSCCPICRAAYTRKTM